MKLDPFTRAYIEAALWSSMDNADEQGGEPLDKNYSASDIAPATLAAMKRDCADFQKKYGHLIEDDDSREIEKWDRWELAGHKFWLSRNGHGSSFLDGDWPKHGDELDAAAESYGDFELYVGDDHLIYAVGHEEAVNEVRSPSRRHTVRDFSTRQEIIDHARGEGATHALVVGSGVTLYFPMGSQYAEARVWRQNGYWHAPAPGNRTVVDKLPAGAEPIEGRSGRRAAETSREDQPYHVVFTTANGTVNGWVWATSERQARRRLEDELGGAAFNITSIEIDRSGKAPRPGEYEHSRGSKFFIRKLPNMKRAVGETFGRRTQWSDWQILDAIDKGHQVTPEAERRAVKLAQLGFIDTRGTWRLTAKGRAVVDQRVPVAAEAKRSGRARKTTDTAMQVAGKLAQKVDGGAPKTIPGGFRWSQKNESAQFTTYSPDYGQKVVVVVSVFEDGSVATNFFTDESLSGQYENIQHFTYGPGGFTSHQVDVEQMVEDIDWVKKTVDGYAESWQQDQPEVDEARRPRARRSTPTARPRRRRATHR